MEIELVNPVPEYGEENLGLNPAPEDLEGKVVGFLCNRKDNARLMFEQMGERMKREWGIEDYRVYEKYNAATGASPELIQQVADESDLVITGSGD